MKILKKFGLATTLLAVSATSALAQEAPEIDVTAAADGFLSSFTSAASVIGGVLISAAFAALIWKWIKGMVFN